MPSLSRTIGGGRAARSARRSAAGRSARAPCVAMKLIASGVANWAAMTRSPSFSRSSSSTTTIMWPARIASIASSIVAKWRACVLLIGPPAAPGMGRLTPLCTLPQGRLRDSRGYPTRAGPERRHRDRVRNQRDDRRGVAAIAIVRLTPSMAILPFSTTYDAVAVARRCAALQPSPSGARRHSPVAVDVALDKVAAEARRRGRAHARG